MWTKCLRCSKTSKLWHNWPNKWSFHYINQSDIMLQGQLVYLYLVLGLLWCDCWWRCIYYKLVLCLYYVVLIFIPYTFQFHYHKDLVMESFKIYQNYFVNPDFLFSIDDKRIHLLFRNLFANIPFDFACALVSGCHRSWKWEWYTSYNGSSLFSVVLIAWCGKDSCIERLGTLFLAWWVICLSRSVLMAVCGFRFCMKSKGDGIMQGIVLNIEWVTNEMRTVNQNLLYAIATFRTVL